MEWAAATLGDEDSGAVVALLEAGEEAVFAYAPERRGAPIDPFLPFEIGSVAKAINGLVLKHLDEAGRISLGDPVEAFAPGLAVSSLRGIPLVELLTHYSGLPSDPSHPDHASAAVRSDFGRGTVSVADLFGWAAAEKKIERTRFRYGNFGPALAGQLVANRLGVSYEELVRTVLLDPLGMRDTSFAVPAVRAAGHRNIGPLVVATPTSSAGAFAPAGVSGPWSSARDLALLLAAVMSGRAPGWRATEAVRDSDAETGRTGLGWFTTRFHGRKMVNHTGLTLGTSSFVGFDREARIGLVLLRASASTDPEGGFKILARAVSELG